MVELRNRRLRVEIILQIFVILLRSCLGSAKLCGGALGGRQSNYLTGDLLRDSWDCVGPDGREYPHHYIANMIRRQEGRTGRALKPNTMDPVQTTKALLAAHEMSGAGRRVRRDTGEKTGEQAECTVGGSPPRLCKSTYNTTAPMYGVSLTSGQPVTIVQKFPDLLQQVIYETCDSSECDILHGECIQTFVPYLFLVIPLGPVTLTGQDYVLVESGCTCRPKYATPGTDPNPQDIIPNFN